MTVRVLTGDALTRLRELPDESKPISLPDQPEMAPSKAAIRWHLEEVYVP
jgi:hypothetical protein